MTVPFHSTIFLHLPLLTSRSREDESLYKRFGFTVIEQVVIPMPDGTTIAGASMEKPVA
jgi:hypothetical protein